MEPNVRDVLASHWTDYSVVRQLHDVPPHVVYEVRVNGRRAVFKGDSRPTGSAGPEGRVMAFVLEKTSVPVPAILAVGDDYYVAAWHPNAPEPDVGQTADEAWAQAAGRGLATLHAETAPVIETYGQFRPSSDGDGVTVDGTRNWHAAATAYLRRRRAVLQEHGHADVADAVISFLNDRPDAFDGAGDPVCCHGWASPEHVSVVDGRVACVVDFEHAIAAPGEFDYWRTVAPTFERDADEGDGHSAEARTAAFRDGYESVTPLPTGLERRGPFYRLLNRVFYLESLYVQERREPDATAERAGWLRESVFELLDEIE